MSEDKNIQISLRLSPEVYKMLKSKTGITGLSLNAQVIQAIIEHCQPDDLRQRIEYLESLVHPPAPTDTPAP